MRLILHHWDTDGICAAAMLYDKDTSNVTPKIGNYFLEKDEIEKIKKGHFGEIYIVDVALHEKSLSALAKIASIRVFDHHHTKKIATVDYVNPIIAGKDEEDYPSASWIVANVLNKRENLLAFLGAVGDWEERLKNMQFYKKLEKFMVKNNVTFEEMHTMTQLIDSNYKVGDKEEVERAVSLLSQTGDVKEYILSNEKWRNNKELIDREISEALNVKDQTIGGVLIKEINSKYNIISAVARRVWDKKNYVMVVNCGYFANDCQIYVRGENCLHLIQDAIKRGYVAGGKKNVMGAIVPKDEATKFTNEIVEILGEG